MDRGILHIYRNVLFGRETLLSSIYFAKTLDIELFIYIPKYKKFNMYFEQDVVQVTLDDSYLQDIELAEERVNKILRDESFSASFVEIKEFSASYLPDISTDFSFMTCPRVIKGLLNKIYPGQIGPIVRKILLNARFPVYLPSIVFKPWKSIVVMFGGSTTSMKAAFVGEKISKRTGIPLYFFTQNEGKNKLYYEELLKSSSESRDILSQIEEWFFFDGGDFSQNLYEVPHNSLVVAGIFGHNILKGLTFGGKLELMQSIMPNNFLLVGPFFDEESTF